jgi:hypothetical protein
VIKFIPWDKVYHKFREDNLIDVDEIKQKTKIEKNILETEFKWIYKKSN